MGVLQKIGCTAFGCVLAVFAVVVAVVFIFGSRVVHPPPERQAKDIVTELRKTAGPSPQEGLSILVLLDTSGSMAEDVPDVQNHERPKIEIARQVAQKTFAEIEKYATTNPDKPVGAGLVRFSDHVSLPVAMGPVNVTAVRKALDEMTAAGDTAIGDALIFAKKQLNQANRNKNYIILITDGENTSGTPPLPVMQAINMLPEDQRPGTYLVAFDVHASVFKPLQEQGALVLEAKNAVDLQAALDYVLYEKILVEQP